MPHFAQHCRKKPSRGVRSAPRLGLKSFVSQPDNEDPYLFLQHAPIAEGAMPEFEPVALA